MEILLDIPGQAILTEIGIGQVTRSCRIAHNAALAVGSQG